MSDKRKTKWLQDYEDAEETERVKASYSPERQERNEAFVQALGAFCEQEHPAIVMNGLSSALVVYFINYYPEESIEDFLELLARCYRTEIRRMEMQ